MCLEAIGAQTFDQKIRDMRKQGDWSRVALLGWVVALVLAAVAMGQWVIITHLPSRPYAESPQGYAKQYVNKGARAPLARHADEPEPYEARCHYPKNAEEANLCEQFRVAEAAEKSLALADSQWWLTAMQTGMAVVAALATAWAAYEAGNAAKAAANSIDVSIRSIEASKDGQRAHFHVDLDRAQLFGGQNISVRVYNYGASTAFAFEWKCDVDSVPLEYVATGKEPTPLNQLIREKDDYFFTAGSLRPEGPTTIVGFMRYKDVFGVSRKLGFAREIIMPHHVIRVVGGDDYNYDRAEDST